MVHSGYASVYKEGCSHDALRCDFAGVVKLGHKVKGCSVVALEGLDKISCDAGGLGDGVARADADDKVGAGGAEGAEDVVQLGVGEG